MINNSAEKINIKKFVVFKLLSNKIIQCSLFSAKSSIFFIAYSCSQKGNRVINKSITLVYNYGNGLAIYHQDMS